MSRMIRKGEVLGLCGGENELPAADKTAPPGSMQLTPSATGASPVHYRSSLNEDIFNLKRWLVAHST
jgi:hypothetical protein